jgi:hypothetical protein
VVTVTSTAPGVLEAGAVATIVVGLLTVNVAELPVPKSTAVAPENPVPVIVTDVLAGPPFGLTAVTTGAGGATYVYRSPGLVALVPPGVVTVMSTAPSVPVTGAVATIVVALLTEYVAGLAEPKSTAVAPVRFVPVIVTDVPPVLGPVAGLTLVTVGGGLT